MMKRHLKYPRFLIAISCALMIVTSCPNSYAQEGKQNKVRLSLDYVKIMNGESYVNIKATAKIDNQNSEVPNITLGISNDFNDETNELGTATTDMDGTCKFVIKNLKTITPDSSNIYNILVTFKGNQEFARASKTLQFKDANLEAKLIKKDSINYITATLKDTSTDSVLSDQNLNVQVQRLFKPLRIGEEFNLTDENGTILVPIEEGIPGIDGNLVLEVVLKDNDEYGTVKVLVNAPVGTPIVDESTFNERTLWSPRNKTPIFILVFTGFLVLGIWGFIIYLITTLYKIYNIKN